MYSPFMLLETSSQYIGTDMPDKEDAGAKDRSRTARVRGQPGGGPGTTCLRHGHQREPRLPAALRTDRAAVLPADALVRQPGQQLSARAERPADRHGLAVQRLRARQ